MQRYSAGLFGRHYIGEYLRESGDGDPVIDLPAKSSEDIINASFALDHRHFIESAIIVSHRSGLIVIFGDTRLDDGFVGIIAASAGLSPFK